MIEEEEDCIRGKSGGRESVFLRSQLSQRQETNSSEQLQSYGNPVEIPMSASFISLNYYKLP